MLHTDAKCYNAKLAHTTILGEKSTKKFSGLAQEMHYIRVERESEKMEKSVSVNGFIASLPKIRKRRIWNVVMDGKVVQGVSASDNRQSTAHKYIESKYPGQAFTLVFAGWRY